jgi:hypothetical protein
MPLAVAGPPIDDAAAFELALALPNWVLAVDAALASAGPYSESATASARPNASPLNDLASEIASL